jgi:hypothetical protein
VRSVGFVVLIAGLALGGCSSSNREAGNLGVRVCIVNESSTAATVVFTKRDTARGEGSVAPGNQSCGEGTFFNDDRDVEATIALASPAMEMNVDAYNPVIGFPEARLFVNGLGCIKASGKEGTKSVWDDGVLLYTVQRLADGQWKEFTVTFAESEQPSTVALHQHYSAIP